MKNDNRIAAPAVSVIMPAYNVEKYIEKAIRSVMTQTFTDWELIVIDDCSSDSTPAIVKRLAQEDDRIRFVSNPENCGVAKTRNRGLDLSTGDYAAFLDSDDIWCPQKLEKQLSKMKEAGADFGYCAYSVMDASGNVILERYAVPERVDYEDLLKENAIGCSTVMLSRKIYATYRFTTEYYHEDYVLWLQLLKSGFAAVGCTECLVSWRYVSNSRSFDKRNAAWYRWKIYRSCLKLPLWKSMWVFGCYAVSGYKKYLQIQGRMS